MPQEQAIYLKGDSETSFFLHPVQGLPVWCHFSFIKTLDLMLVSVK